MKPTNCKVAGYAVLLTLFVMGCGSRGAIETDPARMVEGDCVLAPGVPERFDPITVVVTEEVDPAHAPVPANEAERLVFWHLYETLVTLDCGGGVRAALARSWKQRENGRIWEFTLRENARFSDGSHLDAEDVRDAWRALYRRGRERGQGGLVHPDSVRIVEDRILVSLSEPAGKEPFIFAHPRLSVIPPGAAGWPVGSGSYLFAHSTAGTLTLIPNPYHPEESRGKSALEIRIRPGTGTRDVLSGSGDVLFIEDRAALEFARSLEGRSLHPLAWSFTYFLESPDLVFVSLNPDAHENLDRLRIELARDVVASDAKPAADPGCPEAGGNPGVVLEKPLPGLGGPLEAGPSRILYPARNRDARRLAERLVALALTDNRLSTSSEPRTSMTFPFPLDLDPEAGLVAIGVEDRVIQDAMASGREWGMVVPHHVDFPDPCLDRRILRRDLDWLEGDPLEGSSPVVPLVSTRRHLALRDGLVGVEMDWGGTVLLNRAGWAEETTP